MQEWHPHIRWEDRLIEFPYRTPQGGTVVSTALLQGTEDQELVGGVGSIRGDHFLDRFAIPLSSFEHLHEHLCGCAGHGFLRGQAINGPIEACMGSST